MTKPRHDMSPEEIAALFPNGVKTVPVMATDRSGAPPEGTVIETPTGNPDLIVTLMTPLAQVAVRGLRTYVQALLGLLLVALAGPATGVLAPTAPGDFLAALKIAGGLAVAPAVVSILQNVLELLVKIDQTWPKARA